MRARWRIECAGRAWHSDAAVAWQSPAEDEAERAARERPADNPPAPSGARLGLGRNDTARTCDRLLVLWISCDFENCSVV